TQALQLQIASKQVSGLSLAIFGALTTAAVALTVGLEAAGVPDWVTITILVVLMVPALYVLFALKVANEWEKAIVLRAGKFHGLGGAGLFWVVPIVDTIPTWIDHRVMVTPFNAEKTLTQDTVPVDVDAVLFWVVWDAKKAALEVEDYRVA